MTAECKDLNPDWVRVRVIGHYERYRVVSNLRSTLNTWVKKKRKKQNRAE